MVASFVFDNLLLYRFFIIPNIGEMRMAVGGIRLDGIGPGLSCMPNKRGLLS